MRSVVVAVALLASAGCASSGKHLAKVNHETLTGKELRLEFARHHYALEKLLTDDGDVRKYVDRLVDRRLFVQEGYRLGLQDAPDVREGVARLRAQKIVELFLQEEVEARTTVSDEEVKAAHERLADRLEVRQLVLKTREEAEAAAAALAAGGDLEKLARERSIAETAKRGGMTVVTWGMDEAYERTLFALPEGGTSPVFRSTAGWEVARVEKRKTVDRPPLEKVAAQIRQVLRKRKRLAREEELYSTLWSKFGAKVLECAPDVATLKAAAAGDDQTACASWRGGTVTTRALAGRVKLEQLDAVGTKWPELRKALVEDLVNREVVKLEAEERGYGQRPEVVEKVAALQDDLVESKLYREYVVKDVRVGEEDARRHYDANAGEFVEDAQLELAQILVDSQETANEVAAKVRSRQPFVELVAAYSKDKRNVMEGGRVGFVAKGLLKDEFAPVAALAEGEVSPPIRASDGYHLVKVLSIRPERQRPFEEVKEQARARALEVAQKAEVNRWVATLRAAAKIEVSERGIRAYGDEVREQLRRDQEAKRAKAAAAKPAAEAPPGAASPAAEPQPTAAAPSTPSAAPNAAPAAPLAPAPPPSASATPAPAPSPPAGRP